MKICKKTAFFFFFSSQVFFLLCRESRQQNNLCRRLASFIFYAKRKQMRRNHSKIAEDGSSKLEVGWGKYVSSVHTTIPSFAQCNSLQCFFFFLSELCLSLLLAPLISIVSPKLSPATSHTCWVASLLLRAANNAFLTLACVSTLEAEHLMDWSPSLWDWTTEWLRCRGPRGWPSCTLNLMKTGAYSELGFSEAQRAVCCSVLVYFL